MKNILLSVVILSIYVNAKPLNEDIQLFLDKEAHILSFGGVVTPQCKIKLSNDNKQLDYVSSSCVRLTNSKGIRIICNKNKSVCKTENEMIDYLNFL